MSVEIPTVNPVVSVGSSEILFKGFYEFGLDSKRRVQVPSKWRPASADFTYALFFANEEHEKLPCLTVMTQEGYLKLVQRFSVMKAFDPKIEAFKRYLGAHSDDAPLDKAGRICLPERFVQLARLAGQAQLVLVGLMDRFQIWHPEYYQRVQASDKSIASELKRDI